MATKLIRMLLSVGVVIACLQTPARAQQPKTKEQLAEEALVARRAAIAKTFEAKANAQGSTIAAGVLQIVGQVIVDRATEAGWSILRDKLRSSLDCDDDKTLYKATCKVLDKVRIQDVIAAPRTLLDAAIADFAVVWQVKLKPRIEKSTTLKAIAGVTIAVGSVLVLWSSGHEGSTIGVVRDKLRDKILELAATTCPKNDQAKNLPLDLASSRAGWAIGFCLAEPNPKDPTTGKEVPKDVAAKLADCALESKLKCVPAPGQTCTEEQKAATCNLDGEAYDNTLAIAQALKASLTAKDPLEEADGVMTYLAHGAAQRMRDTKEDPQCVDTTTKKNPCSCYAQDDTKQEKDNFCANLVEEFSNVAIGVVRHDWNRVAVGATSAFEDYGKLSEEVSGTRFYKLISAIGQYALTYVKQDVGATDSPDAAKARRDIIESLIKSTVNREDRSGVVFSLGGAFGLGVLGHKTFGDGTTSISGPFVLPIGIGMQSYRHEGRGGIHLELGLFDIGQYVSLDADHQAKVGTPDVKAAIAPSITIGGWFLSRSVPIFAGVHGGFAPFVITNGHSEYFGGVMVGAYVPIFDF